MKIVKGTYFICKDCGEVFDEYECINGCPNCRGENYDDAVMCEACGEWIAESESYDGYCSECLKAKATPENVIEFCEDDEKTDVEINFAAVSILKSIGIDINKLVTAYALDMAKNSPFKDRAKIAAEICAKVELDTAFFMKKEFTA